MTKFNLPYFKHIDSQNLQDEYDAEIQFNDRIVNLFLNEIQLFLIML